MTHIIMQGNTVCLCHWKVKYSLGGKDITEYTPTEEEADVLVDIYQGSKEPVDVTGYEWVDGITVPPTSTMPKTDAEAIIARGKSAYFNSLNIPSAEQSAVEMMRKLLKAQPVEDDDEKIRVSGLYDDWSPGDYSVGDIRNANGQTWECYSPHKNSEHPDINPDSPAWFTFWRPLHGKSPDTARPWVKPEHGTTDMYHTGEYMIYTDGALCKCLSDTNFSPDEYAQAWENRND